MERIIEFRGKRIDNNEWVYGFYIHCPDDGHLIIGFASELTDPETGHHDVVEKRHQVVPESVGQLIRKNDVIKLFEGDYVSYDLMEGLGEPKRYGLKMVLKMFSFSGWETNIRLLGNVHDSPEINKSHYSGF